MKKIKIKGFCKMSWLSKILFLLLLAFAISFLAIGITANTEALVVAGGIMLLGFVAGMGCYFNYGITISSKRVTVFYIDSVKVFDYKNVSRVSIIFYEDSISCAIKAKDTPLYEIYLGEFEINSSKSSILSDKFSIKIKTKITDNMIEKWTKNLPLYTNVHITNKIEKY